MPIAPTFVHLRLHTEYSVVDGTLRIDDAAAAAKADGQVALAIADLNNLFGTVQFYKACRGKGIKPIIGVDVWMEPLAEAGDKQPSRLLLLVQDVRGYHNLSDCWPAPGPATRSARRPGSSGTGCWNCRPG
jgi:DNA polymerase-3 subunit alpha